jgi:dTDP-4-amino-4,6-dideoxygalactose transaminase
MAKTLLAELAILGGKPSLSKPLFVGCPNIGDRDKLFGRMNDLLDRRQLSNNGPFVEEFEQRIAEFTNVRHAVAVCNATLGLELAIRGLDLKGEVIIPSMTFVATAHSLQWHGLTPVFCDVDPETHNLDPRRVEELITPRTSAVMGVHLWGRPCAVESLTEITRRHGLRLLFDSAHAIGCSHRSRMIGGFGDAEVFSFHATKILNSLEGGMIMTNDSALAERFRLMRNFGFAGYDNSISVGTNAKMHEMSAAMGLTSLESFPEFVDHNLRNYQQYREQLSGIPGLSIIQYDEREQCNFQYVVLEVDSGAIGLDRDELVRTLWAENILARKYFAPGCHQMQAYKDLYPDAAAHLPMTQRLANRLLVLPTGTTVGEKEVNIVCSILSLAIKEGAALAEKIRKGNPAGGSPQKRAA